MSQMLKISISPWCRELLESHVSSKLKSMQPEVAKDQQQTQASAGLFGSIYSYFTEPSKSPRNESKNPEISGVEALAKVIKALTEEESQNIDAITDRPLCVKLCLEYLQDYPGRRETVECLSLLKLMQEDNEELALVIQ